MAYNCEIINKLGMEGNNTVKSRAALGPNFSYITLYIGRTLTDMFDYANQVVKYSVIVDYIESLGYDNVSSVIVYSTAEDYDRGWLFDTEEEEGLYLQSLENLDSPIIDMYLSPRFNNISLRFYATVGTETISSERTHSIDFEIPEGVKIRTLAEFSSLMESIGFETVDSVKEHNAQISFYCEEIGSSTTSSTVVISSDISTSTVVNTITNVKNTSEVFRKYAKIKEDYDNGTLDIEARNEELLNLYNN